MNNNIKACNFISKLIYLLNNKDQDVIVWSNNQNESFIIKDIQQFIELLESTFKLDNYSSFIRQLNMYGFNKVKSQNKSQEIFYNKYLLKDNLSNVSKIKRKIIKKNSSKNSILNKYNKELFTLKSKLLNINDSMEILNKQIIQILDNNIYLYKELSNV